MTVRLHLIFRLTVPRDRLTSFLARAVPVYEQPGGIRVRLLERRDVPGEYIEELEYDSEERFLTDQRRADEDPDMRRLIAEWRSLLSGPPTVVAYREVALEEPTG